MSLSSHQLARRLLELPDLIVATVDGDVITEANEDTYDTSKEVGLPYICLEVNTDGLE